MKTEYKLQECNSLVKPLKSEEEIKQAIQEFSDATLVAFFENQMIVDFQIGKEWGSFDSLKFITQLRMFDSNKELFVFKTDTGIEGRLRSDAEGEVIEFFESVPILNGTSFDLAKEAKYIIVSEKKGTSFTISRTAPFEELVGNKKRLAIISRNYIGYTKSGQAGIVDSRLCELTIVEPEKL